MEQLSQVHLASPPGASELPQPKFLKAHQVEVELSSCASDTECSTAAASSSGGRQELRERLQQLRDLQDQSLVKYLQYAQALAALGVRTNSGLESAFSPGIQPSASWASENRTTFVLKELPSDCNQDSFWAQLVAHGFKGHFDLLYIPYDWQRGCNLGYGIINLTEPQHAGHFRAALADQGLLVEAAELQGYEANYCKHSLKWFGQPPLGRNQLSDRSILSTTPQVGALIQLQ